MIHHNHIHHTDATHLHHTIGLVPQMVLALPFIIGLVVYLMGVFVSSRRGKPWPVYRTALWATGAVCSIVAVAGPLAERAHLDFSVHMVGHLLLGMLAPLLMVLAAPMTLILRTLPVPLARRVSRLLKSRYVRFVTDPIVASLLNVGALWILYTTHLYTAMHEYSWLHVLIHFHVFLAGYVFTISMIYIDPTPHRTSFMYRSIVLILALAAHGILSKFIYANPPAGIAPAEAQFGGMLMYYGGDAVDILIIFILCYQWYKASRPRPEIGRPSYSLEHS
ncbi:cytochrome c oxidase assembly protein [Alkalihalobacterium chitinilyticum]|uniref:Cytochrome c oxidase assembly protein n=1 Tax=Alkalihalobacterium chitinilyticum TaxID=2980103 RepID=A0ABT5VG15_9BACI|nr:cytochrome c oxidase assembly protein [Alkalihalobacterium chitinilyticum]MDE5413667.1 cytochrome c oxidase assembly protein [Alkalihalobacterium chitinilyticum]